MATRYEGVPASLQEELFPGGWFRTGDLGKLAADGSLTITGRKRLFIPTAGHKVDPIEIEEMLAQHPAVAEAAVVGVPEPSGEELVKAVIVPRGPCGEEEIRRYCQERLADFKVPRIVELRDKLPRSPLGKLLRKDMIDRPAGPRSPSEDWSPERVLRFLQERVAELLEIPPERVEAGVPLGDLGLGSILLVDVLAHVRETLAVSLSPTGLWRYPDLASLAAHLSSLTRAGAGGGTGDR
jgi:long-chain acyl-CoA synthetase